MSGRPANDAGFMQVRSISEFDFVWRILTGDESDVVRRITRAVTVGHRNMVRVFLRATVLFNLDDAMSGYWEAVARVVELCNAAGLYVEFVVFCDTKNLSADECRRILSRFLARYAKHPGVLIQLVNEPGLDMQSNFSGATDPLLFEMASTVEGACGHRDFSIGDPMDGSDEDASKEMTQRQVEIARHCNIIVLHPARDYGAQSIDERFRRWIDHMEGFSDVVAEAHAVNPNVWGFLDEPMGFADTRFVAGHEREYMPEAALAAELTAQMIGCGFTYHYISAQNDGTPGLDLCGRIVPELPPDPSWVYKNDSWQGSATRGFGGYGKVRTYTNGASAFVLASGRQKGAITWANGFTPRDQVFSGSNVDVFYAD